MNIQDVNKITIFNMAKIEELLQQVCKEHCVCFGDKDRCGALRNGHYCKKALGWDVDCDHIASEEIKLYTI